MGNRMCRHHESNDLSIEELRFETNPRSCKHPTIWMKWQTPTASGSQHPPRDIEYVVYANDSEIKVVSAPATSVTIDTLTPFKEYTIRVITRNKRTKKKGLYYQEFKTYLDWKCKRPDCEKSRWVVKEPIYLPKDKDSVIYEYCSVQDKVVWEMDHCIYGDCRRIPAHNSFFCDDERNAHRYLAKQQGEVSFVLCPPSSQKFQDMERTFHKNWGKEKDLTPTVCIVVAIVNPYLEDRFEAYKSSLRRGHQKTEFHYHGTKLRCPLLEYYMPCQQKECSVCGISRKGFLLDHVSADYQHFAKAFYLAPNSSKCHDYCATSISSSTNSTCSTNSNEIKLHQRHNAYNAMLYCKVVTGKKYHLKRSETFIDGPPDGYHTVYGKSKHMPFLHSDRHNEELVVFEEDAIVPQYIICYTT